MSTTRPSAFHIVIPARFASERLPGKVLLDLAGRPLLQHVWHRACESTAESGNNATEYLRIVNAAQAVGGPGIIKN
jgi:3-deoxy-manno-octulosonate cytidylyltransferase (CMP-KDO synthetase)